MREHQNINKGSTYQAALFDKSTTNMGRKRASNDIDFVEPPKYDVLPSWKAKKRPPEPWPLPNFKPLHINNPLKNSKAKLPNDVNLEDPYQIFKLIYTDELLEELTVYINKYIKLHSTKKKNIRRLCL